jgi:hypothetical protein
MQLNSIACRKSTEQRKKIDNRGKICRALQVALLKELNNIKKAGKYGWGFCGFSFLALFMMMDLIVHDNFIQ